jgi:hypothetical protein
MGMGIACAKLLRVSRTSRPCDAERPRGGCILFCRSDVGRASGNKGGASASKRRLVMMTKAKRTAPSYAAGLKGGCPRRIDHERVKALRAEGKKHREIAAELGISMREVGFLVRRPGGGDYRTDFGVCLFFKVVPWIIEGLRRKWPLVENTCAASHAGHPRGARRRVLARFGAKRRAGP